VNASFTGEEAATGALIVKLVLVVEVRSGLVADSV
jgi:hypothetical protein